MSEWDLKPPGGVTIAKEDRLCEDACSSDARKVKLAAIALSRRMVAWRELAHTLSLASSSSSYPDNECFAGDKRAQFHAGKHPALVITGARCGLCNAVWKDCGDGSEIVGSTCHPRICLHPTCDCATQVRAVEASNLLRVAYLVGRGFAIRDAVEFICGPRR